jgi:hypothetical protein
MRIAPRLRASLSGLGQARITNPRGRRMAETVASPLEPDSIGAVSSVLWLPLAAVVLAELLTAQAGAVASPFVIVGLVIASLTAIALRGALEVRAGARRRHCRGAG